MDLQMPRMGGLTLLNIVVITATDDPKTSAMLVTTFLDTVKRAGEKKSQRRR